MPGLGVNIDHVATIRQARRTVEPDPVWAAAEAQLGGADCITFHLRKDRRHIIDRDAYLLKEAARCKLNMEMSLDEEIVAIALEIRPDQATLVPESREEITTEGGLDVVHQVERVAGVVGVLRAAGVEVSAFIDPEPAQIQTSADVGFQAIEIHTGTYANAWTPSGSKECEAALEQIRRGVELGGRAGLVVHGGHGLTYDNVRPVADIEGFCEFNIGHSIVSRAVFTGLRQAVADMKRLIDRAAGGNR